MASKIYPTFSKGLHGTSNHLNCMQLVLFTADRECLRGWMRVPVFNVDKLFMLLSRLDVKLSIWDRNFQNNNCFHLEISIRILKTYYFYGFPVSSFKLHILLLSLKNAEPDSAKLSPCAPAVACIQREIYIRGFLTWGAMQWTLRSEAPVACRFVLITE